MQEDMQMVDRPIAHNLRLEEHLIGCMILDPECIPDVITIAQPGHFYNERYKKICRRIYALWNAGEQVDIAVLWPTIEEVKIDPNHIMDVIHSIPTTANVQMHAEQLRDLAALRVAIRIGDSLGKSAHLRDSEEIREVISRATSRLARVMEVSMPSKTMSTVGEIVRQYSEDLEQRCTHANGTGITGLESGFPDLDRMTAGFQKTDFIVVAARPSVGKTAFAGQIASNMSVDRHIPGLFASLEMSGSQLIQRQVSNIGMVDQQNMRTGSMSAGDWERFTMAAAALDHAPLVIDDQGNMSIPELRAKARKVEREYGLQYIMVDYLQLMRGEKGMNRYETVTHVAQELKNIAKEFNIPVIALSQLSRNIEQRQDKRPIMSDLRESGMIEQAADMILFLHRDDYYDAGAEKKGILEVIVAKQRNGPVGTVELAFIKQYGRFAALNRNHIEQEQPAVPTGKPIPDMYRGKGKP